MCARFALHASPKSLTEEFGLFEPPVLEDRYNIAPGQLIAVVGLKKDQKTRGMAKLMWGFVPYWANDPDRGPKPKNARVETVATKPPFDESFRSKRCLIPADGFYEWATENRRKIPFHFRLKSGKPFGFAGVWDVWKAEGRPPLLTCAIITVAANDLIRPFHDRKPAIIPHDQYGKWLDSATQVSELLQMLVPFPAERMESVRASTLVNKATNEGPECLGLAK